MKKLSAVVVIVALLCSGTAMASAVWDWDVTARVSSQVGDSALGVVENSDIPEGYWFYEYAWVIVENNTATNPANSWISIGSCPEVLFEHPDFSWADAQPDIYNWMSWYTGPSTDPNWGSLPAPPQWIQDDLGYDAYTGGYFLTSPGSIRDDDPADPDAIADGARVAAWWNFTTDARYKQDAGLAFYTAFLACRPPTDVEWGIDNAYTDGGITRGPTPEPASALLLLLGLPAAAALRRRRE